MLRGALPMHAGRRHPSMRERVDLPQGRLGVEDKFWIAVKELNLL